MRENESGAFKYMYMYFITYQVLYWNTKKETCLTEWSGES